MKKLIDRILSLIGKVNWDGLRLRWTGRSFNLTAQDLMEIFDLFKKGNYIILTRRKSHLSTYAVNIGNFLLTGRWGYWSHVSMNVEPNYIGSAKDVRILESTGKGVTLSLFHDVACVDSICILRPLISERFDWEAVVQAGLSMDGMSYDNFCNLDDGKEVNCVELILDSLKKDPEFKTRFHGLAAMIRLEKNLTPDFFYECGSFEIVYERRR